MGGIHKGLVERAGGGEGAGAWEVSMNKRTVEWTGG